MHRAPPWVFGTLLVESEMWNRPRRWARRLSLTLFSVAMVVLAAAVAFEIWRHS